MLKQLRKRHGWVEESPVPVRPELLIESPSFSYPDHYSQSMRLAELPGTSVSDCKGIQVEPGKGTILGVQSAHDDVEPTSATSCSSQPKPCHPLGRPCYNPLHHHQEPAVNPDTDTIEKPATRYSGTVIYTPSCLSCVGGSDTTSTISSHFTSSQITLEGDHTHHVSPEYELPLLLDERLVERRNECRFRSLMQSRHGFHHSRTFASCVYKRLSMYLY